MPKPSLAPCLLLCTALFGMPASAQTPLERLSWLAGCWARETSVKVEPGSGEQWMAPAGGSMLGLGRTIRGGKTIEHEFMQISQTDAGQLVYTASPSGQPPTRFPLLRQGEGELVFENLQHDFPQRVIYRLAPGGRLHARIEGQRGELLRGIDFAMHRVACDAAPEPAKIQQILGQQTMSQKISGEFDVKMIPQAQDGGPAAPARMLLDKRYHGALDATASGQMLAMGTAVKGSAGYVAMELVSGTLGGRRGSFALQHSGTMDRGAPVLSVTVVPDSGTEQLQGLSGRLHIRIEGGKHYYDFEYRLGAAP